MVLVGLLILPVFQHSPATFNLINMEKYCEKGSKLSGQGATIEAKMFKRP